MVSSLREKHCKASWPYHDRNKYRRGREAGCLLSTRVEIKITDALSRTGRRRRQWLHTNETASYCLAQILDLISHLAK